MTFRVGFGYDIHKLVHNRKLVLGGVEIPYKKGLLGHSDGDVLLHAVVDALLGATGLGDIGQLFPDTDPTYKDADSSELLTRVFQLVSRAGWRLVNIDSNVIAEAPKLSPHLGSMREKIASILDASTDSVSIKARTAEGLDAVGRGEAIISQAIVLLEKKGK